MTAFAPLCLALIPLLGADGLEVPPPDSADSAPVVRAAEPPPGTHYKGRLQVKIWNKDGTTKYYKCEDAVFTTASEKYKKKVFGRVTGCQKRELWNFPRPGRCNGCQTRCNFSASGKVYCVYQTPPGTQKKQIQFQGKP